MILNDARCTREIKPRIAMAKSRVQQEDPFHPQIGLTFKEETGKVLHLEHSFGAGKCKLRKVVQKCLESFQCGAGEGKEKIFRTDLVRNEEVLHRIKEVRNILHTIKRRQTNWIGHILRRNCLLKRDIEEKIEGRI
jgi:hypothetical protein